MAKKLQKDGDPAEVSTGSDGPRVWASIDQRVRTGKIESVNLSMGASRSVGSGETIEEAIASVARMVRAEEKELLDIIREEENI